MAGIIAPISNATAQADAQTGANLQRNPQTRQTAVHFCSSGRSIACGLAATACSVTLVAYLVGSSTGSIGGVSAKVAIGAVATAGVWVAAKHLNDALGEYGRGLLSRAVYSGRQRDEAIQSQIEAHDQHQLQNQLPGV